jgi:ribulose-phosphate 3-epimerase
MTGAVRPSTGLSVGVMTIDWRRLETEVAVLSGIDCWAHVDVMDGRFCGSITAGAPFVKAVAECGLRVDVHLMVEEPLRVVGDFVKAGAHGVTVHVESSHHIHRVVQEMTNVKADVPDFVRGVALNPGTPIAVLEPVLGDLDLVLLLTIDPGWGGQSPSPTTPSRISQVRSLATSQGHPVLVQVDGAVTHANAASIAAWRPDVIVSGSAIFDGGDAAGNLDRMREELQGWNESMR